MSRLTTLGITCSIGDIPTVLGLNTIFNMGMEQKSVGVEHFALFIVVMQDITDEILEESIGQYKSTLWLYPESSTMIVEDSDTCVARFIVLPDEVVC
jgi:hypothetical protein